MKNIGVRGLQYFPFKARGSGCHNFKLSQYAFILLQPLNNDSRIFKDGYHYHGYEKEWLINCPNDLKPLFYRCYVDDTFAVFREITHNTDFFNYINNKHKSLKFTFELENNRSLPFIGITVTRNNYSSSTGICHKPTSTELTTHFTSFTSTVYKLSAIRSLAHEIIHLSSNYEFIAREFNKLSHLFLCLSYPSTLVNKNLKKLFDNWYFPDDSRSVINPNRPTINVNSITYFYQSQYYGNVSLNLSKQLIKLCNQCFKDLKLIFVYRSIRMHDFFFCFKAIEYT